MKPFRRKAGATYYVDLRWEGFPRIQASTRTSNRKRAEAIVTTLQRLRTAGRRDILGLIASGRLLLDAVHDACVTDINGLDNRLRVAERHTLGELVPAWLTWLAQPSTLARRTRKPYRATTIERYRDSWEEFFSVLPKGRASCLTDLTSGFLSEFRSHRLKSVSNSTVNRDLVSLQSFLRWVGDERGLEPPTPKIVKSKEPQGRNRWLTANEIAAVRNACPDEWWTLFGLLVHTGMRLGEAQALCWADIRYDQHFIAVQEKTLKVRRNNEVIEVHHKVKTEDSVRPVLLTKEAEQLLVIHAATVPSYPGDYLFPDRRRKRGTAYKAWRRVIAAAQIPHATVHDLRHTFGVHSLMAGIPLPRLQRLMGHASPAMTLRYAQHLPDDYLQADAESLSKSLTSGRVVKPGPFLELVKARA